MKLSYIFKKLYFKRHVELENLRNEIASLKLQIRALAKVNEEMISGMDKILHVVAKNEKEISKYQQGKNSILVAEKSIKRDVS